MGDRVAINVEVRALLHSIDRTLSTIGREIETYDAAPDLTEGDCETLRAVLSVLRDAHSVYAEGITSERHPVREER